MDYVNSHYKATRMVLAAAGGRIFFVLTDTVRRLSGSLYVSTFPGKDGNFM